MLTRARKLQKTFAKANGYFWLPCPVCKQEFGGHEWQDWDGLPSSVPVLDEIGLAHGICPDCTRQGYGYPYGFFDEVVIASSVRRSKGFQIDSVSFIAHPPINGCVELSEENQHCPHCGAGFVKVISGDPDPSR